MTVLGSKDLCKIVKIVYGEETAFGWNKSEKDVKIIGYRIKNLNILRKIFHIIFSRFKSFRNQICIEFVIKQKHKIVNVSGIFYELQIRHYCTSFQKIIDKYLTQKVEFVKILFFNHFAKKRF